MTRYRLPLEHEPCSISEGSEIPHVELIVSDKVNDQKGPHLTEASDANRNQININNGQLLEIEDLKKQISILQKENDNLTAGLLELQEVSRDTGYKEGLKSAEENLREDIEALRQLHENINIELQNSIQEITGNIADIVLEANVKILGKQLLDKKNSLDAVREVLKKAGYQENMIVKVSPTDHERLNKHRHKLSIAKNIEYIPDEKVEVGGCIVVTDSGMLDGRIEVQLQALHDLLNEVDCNASPAG